ncbi:hypothetical protein [Cellulosimicrobium sp. 22601]|uniref:hypothetical protein n=1 Tax=unclassified Cellulosimicrobium TaxID=2624466 RepID=UPI003F85AED7
MRLSATCLESTEANAIDRGRSVFDPGGLALRFARVLRYRDDKSADEADTIDAVRALVR